MRTLSFAFGILILSFVTILNAQEVDFDHFKSIKARSIGPAGMSGRVTAIDVNLSNPDHIYVGTASGGIWLSTNAGITWNPIFDDVNVLSIGALKINQANPSEIWVGTGEGNPRNSQNSGAGVYHSLDGGKSWTYKGLKDTRVIHRIIIDERSPGTIYVGAQGAAWGDSKDRGVFKTTNSGEDWNKVLFVNKKTGVADMVMDPKNPNKLIVSMWEYGRKPWTFNSGGEGSGIHITYDGGATWKKISSEEGLPKGNLGRIGVAISSSNPEVVYALVEAKENALYKSSDGGEKWNKISTDENMGNRPFYYAEIYVDPQNENRLYSLWSYVSMSEDGGKTFKVIADYGNDVHPDHHAFWIHPEDPNYLIDGNDGGMNISHDMGKNWRFVTNLPVGQFYHVNVDDDFPYNVYGGMQDNGSWVGPGFTLKSGGITNHDWQEVYFGDGFDVAPKPGDSRYVYAMAQGGSIGLVDKVTGATKFIKPNHPDSVVLRYNWNAPLALEPGTDCGLYYGSQFVHYSSDCGRSWTVISPDLTTNDTSKQHQDISGGLTIDATNAENNTTLISIAPSSVDKDVIWTGSDDGRLHVTRDGGSQWIDVYSKLPGAPKNGWIPKITTSDDVAGKAYVVVNNYRLNDWKPYLYVTTNYGNSWKRLVGEGDIPSFVTSIIEDSQEPNLLFMGTDAGLYISFDGGTNWQQWKNGLPPAQIRDLAIQHTFDDLVLGTFGRALWIIDDIGPFRRMARDSYLKDSLTIVSSTNGYLSERRSYQGIRFVAQSEFVGDNKNTNAMLSIWVMPNDDEPNDEEKEKKEKLKIAVIDSKGDTARKFSQEIKEKGLIRTSWNLRVDGVSGPSRKEEKVDADLPFGSAAMPGIYTIHVILGNHTSRTQVEVRNDPRLEISSSEQSALITASKELEEMNARAKNAFDKIVKANKSISLIEKLTVTLDKSDSTRTQLEDLTKSQKKELKKLELLFLDDDKLKGIQRNPKSFRAVQGTARRYVRSSYGTPGPNAKIAVEKAKMATEKIVDQVDVYMSEDWKAYQKEVDKIEFQIFK
ncbi:MAG: photosystem II stability/assembly factor-like uncharacterized protein [Saprospiraceae bacterium]|jgi:photosystem II stability/assembly factor-like uncharacterized protein